MRFPCRLARSESVGLVTGLAEDWVELVHLLDTYDHIQQIITDADRQIEALVADLPNAESLQSVGMPAPAAAAIVAYAGDLRQYGHGNQLMRKAGLNLAERSSGKYIGKVRLSKRGSTLLRKHLYYAVIYLIAQNPRSKPCTHTMST